MRLYYTGIRPMDLMVSLSSKHRVVVVTASSGGAATSEFSTLKNTKSWTTLGNAASSKCLVAADRAAKLCSKWMEYQGIRDWEGLLDPLDDYLRKEILRYGDFVEAAYRSFDFDTASPTYATCRYDEDAVMTRCGLGGSGYKVTRNLYGTCAVNVPRWTNLVSPKSSWIGYVAVCDDEDEIRRLGRRDVVIAYRGTATPPEWLENLRATLTCLPDDMAPRNCEPMVQRGFLSLYTSASDAHPSLKDSIRDEITKIIETYGDEPLSITITGHSLGAALATITAYDITTQFRHAPLVTVVSFGGPRVGNKNFRSQLENSGTKVLRIVNSDDPITKVPGFVVDSDDVSDCGTTQPSGMLSWLQKCVDSQWVYAEVGKELRVSSKDSSYSKDVATCHDLKTYLHCIDNWSSCKCPLRATAKRVIEKNHGKRRRVLA
ncbi:PREDICTED: phospholipase A(1) DAD1, chloroplastic-like [Ipomoea nil]|uniref:phospholipase A(1) DAD1, chloroplastic-like n=1 Tax=Ipomoea nil TaxID=35883 RepID=UPI000900C2EC|nr:PREDICTED: phospholipase A(1) DAD1, chloroplastic-like [Ipomoea nil]